MALGLILLALASLFFAFLLTRKNVVLTDRASCMMWFFIIWTVVMLFGLFVGLFR